MNPKHFDLESDEIHENPYYWWWRFLKISDRKLWSKDVKRDFKNLYKYSLPYDDDDRNFRVWFAMHMTLFYPVEEQPILHVKDVATFNEHQSQGRWIISLDKTKTVDHLMKVLEYELRRKKFGIFVGGKGRKTFERLNAKYPLTGRVAPATMATNLRIYEYCMKNPDMPLWKVAEKLGINSAKSKPTTNESPKQRADRHNILTASVSRSKNKVIDILEAIYVGKFPVKE
jgi:hypothetical protein